MKADGIVIGVIVMIHFTTGCTIISFDFENPFLWLRAH